MSEPNLLTELADCTKRIRSAGGWGEISLTVDQVEILLALVWKLHDALMEADRRLEESGEEKHGHVRSGIRRALELPEEPK